MREKYIEANVLIAKGYTLEDACSNVGLPKDEYVKISIQDKLKIKYVENTISLKLFLLSAMMISLGLIMSAFIFLI